ncbi:hypothetical protein [Lysobacter sp. N42]|uniref:hypothetical protein n=1 Tax=Lysobacter sp. N42 TaxID=2545719 RepID=UPI001053E9A6|nr:hypothetical protein [Lysobacter sp. N42]TCZ87199.1 hypothetical protein EYQ95_16740 [Lysobacter sp. N42]
MKIRHVYSTTDLDQAHAALRAAREAGVGEECLTLVARSDIELDAIPNDEKSATGDFMHGAMKGVAAGGATGFLLGLAAMVFAPIGITLAGAGIAALAGAAAGGMASSIFGSALPDPVRHKFEQEIAAGRILLIVDANAETHAVADPAIQATGATRLPFEEAAVVAR